jgi:hypothetical protein
MDKTPKEVGTMFATLINKENDRHSAAITAMAIEAGMPGYPRPADYDPEAAARAAGYTHAEIQAMVAEAKAEEAADDDDTEPGR